MVFRHGKIKSDRYSVDLGENYVSDLLLKVMDNNHLAVSGIYKKKWKSTLEGVCFFMINTSNNTFYQQMEKKFNDEKCSVAKEIFMHDDGKVTLIYEYQENYVSGKRVYYTYKAVSVLRLNAEGNVIWSSTILKNNIFDKYYKQLGSVFALEHEGWVYVFFNDHEANIDNFYDQKKTKVKRLDLRKSITALVYWDEAGNMKKAKIETPKRTYLNTSKHLKLSNGEIVLYGDYDNSYRLGRLKMVK